MTAAGAAVLGLTALPAAVSAHPAAGMVPPGVLTSAAITGSGGTGSPSGQAPAGRFNVGATHSPLLLRQLAASATMGPVTGSPAQAATAAPLPGAPQGVDVASFQHPNGAPIYWKKVAAAGIRFAAVKVTEGAYYTNPYASRDLLHAQAAGLTTAGYAFAIPNGGSSGSTHYSSSPVVQADDLINYLASNNITVNALLLDIEYDPYAGQDGTPAGSWCYGLSKPAMVTWIARFDAEVQAKTGNLPIIYAPPPWWQTCTGGSTASGQIPVWIPDPNSSTSPVLPAGWSNWNIWQYGMGQVNGIQGKSTDLDQLNPGLVTLLSPGKQVTQAGSAIAPLQFAAFTVTPAPSLSYPPSPLPPGLAISSTGQITGTPAQTGSFQVTVTATDQASSTTGSATFTWDVHGSITMTPVTRQTTVAGTPVRVRVTATDPVAGQTPSFTAAGLPPGLSITQHGLIIGWPDIPGIYHPRVTATDALGATAARSFRWAIWRAADRGPAGPVRLGLAGKCLDDRGNRATNGNKIQIWRCDGKAEQNWTVVKDGTLRIHRLCLGLGGSASANGTRVWLQTCNGSPAQEWQVRSRAELVNPHTGKCLTDPGGSRKNGTQPVIWTCRGWRGQAWVPPAGQIVSGMPGRCLDNASARAVNGNRIDIRPCKDVRAQRWSAWHDRTVRTRSRCLTVYRSRTSPGTRVVLWTCNGTAGQRWLVVGGGSRTRLLNPHSGLCLADPRDSTMNGIRARVAVCRGWDPGQLWRVY